MNFKYYDANLLYKIVTLWIQIQVQSKFVV